MKKNNFLIAVTEGSKVTNLYWSECLAELDTVRLLHPDSLIDVMFVDDDGGVKEVSEPLMKKVFARNGKPNPNKVRCKETGEVFVSAQECFIKTGIPTVSIYKSIREGCHAFGKHFEYSSD